MSNETATTEVNEVEVTERRMLPMEIRKCAKYMVSDKKMIPFAYMVAALIANHKKEEVLEYIKSGREKLPENVDHAKLLTSMYFGVTYKYGPTKGENGEKLQQSTITLNGIKNTIEDLAATVPEGEKELFTSTKRTAVQIERDVVLKNAKAAKEAGITDVQIKMIFKLTDEELASL